MSMDRQTVTSVGSPESLTEKNSPIISELEQIGIKIFPPPISKTFRHWNKTPWIFTSRTSVNLAQFESLVVTFVKATDPNTGIEVVFATILATQTTFGWEPGVRYIRIRVLILLNATGLLEEWQVTSKHPITCSSQGEPFSYRTTFRPDWFEIVDMVNVIIEPVVWYSCDQNNNV